MQVVGSYGGVSHRRRPGEGRPNPMYIYHRSTGRDPEIVVNTKRRHNCVGDTDRRSLVSERSGTGSTR